MKIQNWSSWAEIIANLAVVASVVFLSFEVRNNTKSMEAQSIRDRSERLNQAYINSPLIPSILAKIKKIDGPEPGEAALISRYGLTYEEAAIYGRYLLNILSGLEIEYLQRGPSDGLKQRIQLLFLFPDIQLTWSAGYIQIQDSEFIDYVDEVLGIPIMNRISDYKDIIDSLKSQ